MIDVLVFIFLLLVMDILIEKSDFQQITYWISTLIA